jgi:Zn-dependent protease with chaperone function/tetratricopeptide (TPR) repeat protein
MIRHWSTSGLVGIVAGAVCLAAHGAGSARQAIPKAAEIARMVQERPFSQQSWPLWRGRYLSWWHEYSGETDDFEKALACFVVHEAGADGTTLPAYLARDAVAWHLYGCGLLDSQQGPKEKDFPRRAEAAFRRSIELDPKFASPHADLAVAIITQSLRSKPGLERRAEERLAEAGREIRHYAEMDREGRPAGLWGLLAFARKQYPEAERQFRQAMEDRPKSEPIACYHASAVLRQKDRAERAKAIEPSVRRFLDNGTLWALYAVALAQEDRPKEAVKALDRAQAAGVDPAEVLGKQSIEEIRNRAKPSWVQTALWGVAYGVAGYAVAILVTAALGLLVAAFNRAGPPAPQFAGGQIAPETLSGGSWLGTLYLLVLSLCVLLFYLSVPFVLLGLVATTLGVLYLIFLLPRIPIQLVCIVVAVGLGMAVSVFKSLFNRRSQGEQGIRKTEAECPRLHAVLREVAEKTESRPIDDVYINPGSSIGVRQENRGPFGLFGVRRILGLGLATLDSLSIGELKAILAHEYAHFSHRDTAYGCFIDRAMTSIHYSLFGMAQAGGSINYVNPFYWFFVLYARALGMLAAGFSRSREYMADRVAAYHYGKIAFVQGLMRVATEGVLFDTTVGKNISSLLDEGKAFLNIYDSFRTYRDEQFPEEERDKFYRSILNQKRSLFDSHPSFRERVEAVSGFPDQSQRAQTPSIELFDDREALEQAMTDVLTQQVQHARRMSAIQAAQARAQGRR